MQKWKWNSSSHLSCRPAASLEEQNLHFSPLASFLGNSCTFLHLEGCLGEFLTGKLLSKNHLSSALSIKWVSTKCLCSVVETFLLATKLQQELCELVFPIFTIHPQLRMRAGTSLVWKSLRGKLFRESVDLPLHRHRWHPIQGLISVSQIFKHSNIWSNFDANI